MSDSECRRIFGAQAPHLAAWLLRSSVTHLRDARPPVLGARPPAGAPGPKITMLGVAGVDGGVAGPGVKLLGRARPYGQEGPPVDGLGCGPCDGCSPC